MNLVMLGAHGRGLANLTSLVRKSEEIRGLGLTTHSFDEAIIMFSIGNVSHQLLLKDTRFPELGMYYVILAGRNIEAQRDCMVGRVWADAAGISLGSTVDILGSEYNVVGVTHHTYTASDVPAPVFVIPASSLSSVLSSAERCAVRELAYQFCVVLAFKSVRSLDRLADSILRRAPGMELERYPRQNLADLPNREALAFGTLRICLFLLLVGERRNQI